MTLIIAASVAVPTELNALLVKICDFTLEHCRTWIIWCLGFYLLNSLVIAFVPQLGGRKLGLSIDLPEYAYASWVAMIFGAGMGVGMMTWAVAEPIAELGINPDAIRSITVSGSAQDTVSALKWSYLHWGFGAWACYSILGLVVGYVGHRKQLPLTLRTALTPLLGRYNRTPLAHAIDVVTVVVTLLCIIQILGFAIDNLVICLAKTADMLWLLDAKGNATVPGKLSAAVFIMLLACISASSGVGRGVKWISNVNLAVGLLVLILIPLIFKSVQSSFFNFQSSVIDYLFNLPSMMFQVWSEDGTNIGHELQEWQGTWSMFHWAWWLSFSPFVGIFLAKISKGRTVREYLFATIVMPAMICMLWISLAGGTAIGLDLDGAILQVNAGEAIFAMMQHAFDPRLTLAISVVFLVLIITFLVTSIDSALLVTTSVSNQAVNTRKHRSKSLIVWTLYLCFCLMLLIVFDGLDPIRTILVASVLPMTILIVMVCLSFYIVVINDGKQPITNTTQASIGN